MERLSDILARIFTDPAPCSGCRRTVPTFRDRETGRAYCLPCLEDAVEEAEAEMRAERLDMVLIACHSRQVAA